MDAYLEKQKEKLALTYLSAAWQRAKKLPNIDKILGKQENKREMSDEEMLRKVMALNKAFGGNEVKINGN